ncbi:MAG: hypothetical protein Unbinned2250contig1000_36 [Prokaryotic dsDNA virus sp.]|nr:MAG: hypothetical protein Unbinned2250contig1000_36 [Prokaryotic dsDNA virus sp.]|tara:strand:- start:6960 stop:7373 length:414 start_codon:yes stop_codon:yes gene_type:complete
MKNSKITALQSNGTWETKRGDTMYSFEIQFEDEQVGQCNAKTAEPPYALGDTVFYEVTRSTNFGDVLKVTKNDPSAFNGTSNGAPKNDEVKKNIENSWAIKTAVMIIGECKAETYDEYLEQMAILARILLLERDNLN